MSGHMKTGGKLDEKRANFARGVLKEIIAGLLFALCALPAVHAQRIWVPGAVDCAQWIDARQNNRISEQAWLVGFMGGMAYGREINFIEGTKPEQMLLWMDKYCADNPLDSVALGSHKLAAELSKRTVAKPAK